MGAEAGPEHYGREIRESGLAKAERIIGGELKRARWSAEDLDRRRKGDPVKLRIALRLRKESTMTLYCREAANGEARAICRTCCTGTGGAAVLNKT